MIGMSARYTHQQVSDLTSFDYGDEFTSEEQVFAYFTAAAMSEMFGHLTPGERGPMPTDGELREMAEAVLRNGWHLAPGFRGWQ